MTETPFSAKVWGLSDAKLRHAIACLGLEPTPLSPWADTTGAKKASPEALSPELKRALHAISRPELRVALSPAFARQDVRFFCREEAAEEFFGLQAGPRGYHALAGHFASIDVRDILARALSQEIEEKNVGISISLSRRGVWTLAAFTDLVRRRAVTVSGASDLERLSIFRKRDLSQILSRSRKGSDLRHFLKRVSLTLHEPLPHNDDFLSDGAKDLRSIGLNEIGHGRYRAEEGLVNFCADIGYPGTGIYIARSANGNAPNRIGYIRSRNLLWRVKSNGFETSHVTIESGRILDFYSDLGIR